MLQRPIIKPHYHIQVIPGEGVFLLSETHQTILQGRLYERIVPLLDGRGVEGLLLQLRGQVPPARLFYTLNKLEQGGFLREAGDVGPPNEAALWSLQDIDPAAARQRLQAMTVQVTALGVNADALRALLESQGVRLAEKADLGVVATDQYLRRELRDYNRQARADGRSWLLVKPVGNQLWVGPLFRPGQTGCWECLAQRIRANYPLVGLLDAHPDGPGAPVSDRGWTPATQAVAWGLAAGAVAAWVARGGQLPLLDGKIRTIDLATWETRAHTFLKQPACPECGGDTAKGAAQPLVLQSRKKTYVEDGGHRVSSPQETLDRYAHHVSAICGAVTMLERSGTSGDGVMHVYHSGNNIARGPECLMHLKVDLRNSSAGKGTTDVQARASALCEGLERFSAVFRGDEPRKAGRFVEMGEEAIHPNRCMLFSEAQYAARRQRNEKASIFNTIPRPFDSEAEVDWTPVWSLSRQAFRYLPTSYCYFNYPEMQEEPACVSCSNGNAAGNSLEEAILQGFFELVERDSVALWWYNRARVPGVDIDSFREPYLDRLREFLRARHRDLWVLDITSDLKVPAYAAVSHRPGAAAEHIMFGFGAHLDPRIALLRAVTELNQMLAHLLNAPLDGPPAHLNDADTLHWLQTAKLAEHPYLSPRQGETTTLGSYPRSWSDDVKEDIDVCRSIVEGLGMEMLVLNQTRPEIGMPVAKVFVPGLRHFWPRFAPGRLYEVPVKLGWLREPLSEEQLHPTPMFL